MNASNLSLLRVAVPVPAPTPVAMNDTPTVLLEAPIAVKSVAAPPPVDKVVTV